MKGVVAAGDRLTAEAGIEVLKAGGNAFDAVVAACFAAPMCEPALTSAGGGGFLLAVSPNSSPLLYDFFVDVPPKRIENPNFYPIYVDFGDTVQEFHIGAGAIAVPGFVAGLLRVHTERGRLPLREVLTPAIEYAKKGVNLSPLQASFVKLLEPIFTATEEAKKIYTVNGKLIDENVLFKNPDYADFLELIAEEGQWAFYEGEIADKIEKVSIEKGGIIRKEDLARYKVFEREPLKVNFKGKQVYTNPPPSSGGILIAFTLKLLKDCQMEKWGSLNHIASLIESMEVTTKFRSKFVNGNLHKDKIEELLENEDLIETFKNLFVRKLNLWGNTTHISVYDSEGNGAAVTTTNGEGSGIIIPDCGVMLNNMLGEEDLNPKGFFKWEPYVRLPSMMSPTAVFEGEKLKLLLGSAGSNRIRSAILQVLLNSEVFGMNVKEAVSKPRLHFENGTVYVEPGFSDSVIEEVERHYKVVRFREKNLFFGGVQAVTGYFEGAGDERRGGVSITL
ncbi:gamma-glutamyltranspeptidase / glutathione hydrolase [Desulfurobacterium pacificum]|uniref:Glutathione hydrolase proenzyme n=1 Tax=Desulfurobacterium pacificum TaxID=240166 RepID=A0ABY1NFF9_9BACT|nr:gamma-glutamyltransferase [Desulfurobacterium pacificum]SMP07850.1 gamma-glutamyltranspeptidase / glutathione hydrolase [Desulfurobacterium pacificum]